MMRGRQWWLAVIITWLWIAPAGAEDSPGRTAYLKYCGACHGENGKGDGVAATVMHPKPTDLTKLASSHGGKYPAMMVRDVIDGRKILNAHGSAQMPVWGQVFAEDKAASQHDAQVRAQVQALTEYLSSIQAGH